MKKVYDIIQQLRNASGSNEKKDILRANMENDDLVLFLHRTYEPTISYYQTKVEKQASSPLFGIPDRQFNAELIEEISVELAERELTGHAAVKWLSDLYADLAEDWMRELLVMMIERDIKAGVSIGTINKVWKGLLTDEPYMRCSLPKHVDLTQWPWEEGVFEELKYDGTYANQRVWRDGRVTMLSRNGSVYVPEPFVKMHASAVQLVKYFFDLFPDEESIVLNGELEMLDPQGNLMPRAEGNGKFNSILQKGECPSGYTPQYKVWDFIPGSKFDQKCFNMPRRERVRHLSLSFVQPLDGIQLAEINVVHSYDEAQENFRKKRALKLEGSIIKHPDGIWEDGTSRHQVKLKGEHECEVKIKGFVPGKGKNAATFGSVHCESEEGLLEVDVSGFTDEMRQWIHDNRDQVLDKVMTVLYNELVKPGEKKGKKETTKKWSLFLPRFAELRLDKSEADTLARIKDQYENDLKGAPKED